jgi:hypothetical protein
MRVEFPQSGGKFKGGEPIGFRALNQAQVPRHTVDVYIAGHHQLVGADLMPDPEVHSLFILSHHPAQKHIQALAGGFSGGRCDVLPCAYGEILQAAEQIVKGNQIPLRGTLVGLIGYHKSFFQRVMLFKKIVKEMKKIKRVRGVEGTVLEGKKAFEIIFLMIQHKIIGCMIHQGIQLQALVDNGFALSPGQDSCPEAHDLNVLLPAVSMRNTDRVVWNKIRTIVLFVLTFKEFGYRFVQDLSTDNLAKYISQSLRNAGKHHYQTGK